MLLRLKERRLAKFVVLLLVHVVSTRSFNYKRYICILYCRYGTVTSIRMLPEKYCAFVNFKTKEMAGQAMNALQVNAEHKNTDVTCFVTSSNLVAHVHAPASYIHICVRYDLLFVFFWQSATQEHGLADLVCSSTRLTVFLL